MIARERQQHMRKVIESLLDWITALEEDCRVKDGEIESLTAEINEISERELSNGCA